MNPKIEILMATYNGEKYIGEQINSIINQTYTNWNLLIRDDGSKDKTLNIIKKYEKMDNRIILIRDNKDNLGFVKNFEELLKKSRTEFVMFSDQDDYWLENKIEKYVEVIEKLDKKKLEKPLLIHSNSYICDKNLKILEEKFIDSNIAGEKKSKSIFFYYIVQGATVLINRNLIKKVIPFSNNVKLHDRYFHLISEFLGNRIFINESLMKYRQHGNNEIGVSKGSIIKKILKKRYFEESDRNLILEIKQKNEKEIKKDLKREIDEYLELTSDKRNRFSRFYLSKKFKMSIKKRIFLLLKG